MEEAPISTTILKRYARTGNASKNGSKKCFAMPSVNGPLCQSFNVLISWHYNFTGTFEMSIIWQLQYLISFWQLTFLINREFDINIAVVQIIVFSAEIMSAIQGTLSDGEISKKYCLVFGTIFCWGTTHTNPPLNIVPQYNT